MRHRISLLVALWLLASLRFAAASEGLRIALVIGNAEYSHAGRLINPISDSAGMAKLFKDAGFQIVESRQNLGGAAFRRALADFEERAQDADVAVVYFSGHGLELSGQNYLVPVDAVLKREVDVADETVPLSRVINAVEGAKRLKFIILDACRNDPFSISSRKRSITRGLARVDPDSANELIAYSAKSGTVADDGEAGGHSPFTAALLENLTVPGVDVEMSLRHVRTAVIRATKGEQEPFYSGSMGDEFPLIPKPQGTVPPSSPQLLSVPPAPVVKPEPVVSQPAELKDPPRIQAILEPPKAEPIRPPAPLAPSEHVSKHRPTYKPSDVRKPSIKPIQSEVSPPKAKKVASRSSPAKKCFKFDGSNYCQ